MTYAMSTTLDRPYAESVTSVRDALTEQGFGILTEIDLAATLKAKLGVEMPPHVLLGACRPPLAHQALIADPTIGVLLPCNVAVRAQSSDSTVVEALDPESMMALAGEVAQDDTVHAVAAEARRRLSDALDSLGGTPVSETGTDAAEED